MHLDRSAPLTPSAPTDAHPAHLLRLEDCATEAVARVGRKAARLGWAGAQGMATPGGIVVTAERFEVALVAAGALERVRYLEQAALRIDPDHTLAIAASIADDLGAPAVAELARADAEATFARVGAGRVVCRSSSAIEDGRDAAFPGVFLSVLDIERVEVLADAIVDCWRSVVSPEAVRYLLRRRVEPVDLSLAVLVQGQVNASWWGVYVSVDPVTGAAQPQADLSDAAPDAVVHGERAAVRARRRADGRWTGVDDRPAVAAALDAVHRDANRLAGHVGGPVDVEFALPPGDGPPVILQCRPLTAVAVRSTSDAGPSTDGDRRLVGRACAGGRAAGIAVDAGRVAPDAAGAAIAVVERLTTADHAVLFGAAAIVVEHDASALSHVAILCRELGVPLVCGVDGARAALVGRRVVVDGSGGFVAVVAVTASDDGAVAPVDGAPADAVLGVVELLLLALAEPNASRSPHEQAERVARRTARLLGADAAHVVGHPIASREVHQLQRLAVERWGTDVSVPTFLAEWAGRRLRDHPTTDG